MLDDVFFDAGAWLASEAGLSFAEAEGDKFLNGNGVYQPAGWLTVPYVATTDPTRPFGSCQYLPTGVSGAFATLTSAVNPFDVLTKVVYSMRPGYRQGAVWFMWSDDSVADRVTAYPAKRWVGRWVGTLDAPQLDAGQGEVAQRQ